MFVILDENDFVVGMGETGGEATIEAAEYDGQSVAYWSGRAVPASVELVARVRRDGSVPARMVDGAAWPYGVDTDSPGATALCPVCEGCGLVLDIDGLRPVSLPCAPCAGSGVVP